MCLIVCVYNAWLSLCTGSVIGADAIPLNNALDYRVFSCWPPWLDSIKLAVFSRVWIWPLEVCGLSQCSAWRPTLGAAYGSCGLGLNTTSTLPQSTYAKTSAKPFFPLVVFSCSLLFFCWLPPCCIRLDRVGGMSSVQQWGLPLCRQKGVSSGMAAAIGVVK